MAGCYASAPVPATPGAACLRAISRRAAVRCAAWSAHQNAAEGTMKHKHQNVISAAAHLRISSSTVRRRRWWRVGVRGDEATRLRGILPQGDPAAAAEPAASSRGGLTCAGSDTGWDLLLWVQGLQVINAGTLCWMVGCFGRPPDLPFARRRRTDPAGDSGAPRGLFGGSTASCLQTSPRRTGGAGSSPQLQYVRYRPTCFWTLVITCRRQ